VTKLRPLEELEFELPQGVFRWTKNGPEDHWARVHVRLGAWIDLPKAEYDAQKIEPTFWGLQERESWEEGVSGLMGGGS
jgi:hypothetical protein